MNTSVLHCLDAWHHAASASLTSHETKETKIRSKSIINGSNLAIGEQSMEAGGDALGEYCKESKRSSQCIHIRRAPPSLPSFWARKGGQMVRQKEAKKVREGMCALRRSTLHEMPDVRLLARFGEERRCLMRLTTCHVSTGRRSILGGSCSTFDVSLC